MDLSTGPRHAVSKARTAIKKTLQPIPVRGAEDARWSVVSSAVDLAPRPTGELVDLLLEAARVARDVSLDELEARSGPEEARWVRCWPGEHYRLLAALVSILKPAVAVEIGTFQGAGALALAAGHPDTKVVTYDIIPWPDIPRSALRAEDFASGRVEQRIGDLGEPAYLDSQAETLRSADVIFIDGPKDGAWEQRAFGRILSRLTDRRRLVVFDDIRLVPMLQIWRDMPFSKLDATSLGHWSGTGLIHTC